MSLTESDDSKDKDAQYIARRDEIADEIFEFGWFEGWEDRYSACQAAAEGMLWAMDCAFVHFSEDGKGIEVMFFEWPIDRYGAFGKDDWGEIYLGGYWEDKDRKAIVANLRALADRIESEN